MLCLTTNKHCDLCPISFSDTSFPICKKSVIKFLNYLLEWFSVICLSHKNKASNIIVHEWMLVKARCHGSLKMGCVGEKFSLC